MNIRKLLNKIEKPHGLYPNFLSPVSGNWVQRKCYYISHWVANVCVWRVYFVSKVWTLIGAAHVSFLSQHCPSKPVNSIRTISCCLLNFIAPVFPNSTSRSCCFVCKVSSFQSFAVVQTPSLSSDASHTLSSPSVYILSFFLISPL